ncbi:hypothetical protein ACWFMI_25220 [Nocardiopsis terrae]|uniref:hypothetical protein n=1 Tax=Streptomyces sp. NPDC057554 TaxID=3350538 RepID=UPI003684AB77
MGDTPDWQALVLARLTNTDPDEADTGDQQAWMLAYATLCARTGEVDPPEVLADLAQRVDSIEGNLDGLTQATEMLSKAVWDRFLHIDNQFKDIIDVLAGKKPRSARPRPRDTTPEDAT